MKKSWRKLFGNWRRAAVRAMLCLVLLSIDTGVLAGAQEVAPRDRSERQSKGERVSPGEAQIILDEIVELRQEVSALEAKGDIDLSKAAVVRNHLNNLEMRVRDAESRYRESLIESNERFTSESLALTATWINWVAIIFGIVIAVVGIGNFLGSRQSKRELERDRNDLKKELDLEKKQLETSRSELKKEVEGALIAMNTVREQIALEMAGFRREVDDQRKASERTRTFVQAVAERFFSDALLELLDALHKGGVLEDKADKELRNKTKEIEARIFLRYPDTKRAEQAVRTLTALGSEAALPDLSEFASDAATAELRSLAHQAMIRISERRGAAAKAAGLPKGN